jgi:hypothetical protein
MAEHQLTGNALGITWDGTGYGVDRTLWGGEFLQITPTGWQRVAHFRPFHLHTKKQSIVIDWEPMVTAILDDITTGESIAQISAKFHHALIEIAIAIAKIIGEQTVLLTGGCWQNKYLTERAEVPDPMRLHQAGFPKFKKNQRSVEYKNSGWKVSEDRKKIIFTDKNGIGTLKLIGSRDLHFYQLEQIKRVRIVKRADGYYCQFCIDADVRATAKDLQPTKTAVGIFASLSAV